MDDSRAAPGNSTDHWRDHGVRVIPGNHPEAVFWVDPIHRSAGSISRLITTASWPLRTTTQDSGASIEALIS